ncbi:MAG TPA: hypothetical protein VK364_12160 [Hymenobacter sp.]|nr:hypothetical protein [Hymenobacter sp.]
MAGTNQRDFSRARSYPAPVLWNRLNATMQVLHQTTHYLHGGI